MIIKGFRFIQPKLKKFKYEILYLLPAANPAMNHIVPFHDLRTAYLNQSSIFDVKDLKSKNPIEQFKNWFEEARNHPQISEPNAVALATATKDAAPSVRYVLLKGIHNNGFQFYTNLDSRKGKELKENPKASLAFYWEPLHRQVRVEGDIDFISEEESTAYFQSRPRESQIGAHVSKQSSVIPDRQTLDQKNEELIQFYGDSKPISKPDYWNGVVLKPSVIEFWQGQSNRLHDRIVFRKMKPDENIDPKFTHIGDEDWVFERLSP